MRWLKSSGQAIAKLGDESWKVGFLLWTVIILGERKGEEVIAGIAGNEPLTQQACLCFLNWVATWSPYVGWGPLTSSRTEL